MSRRVAAALLAALAVLVGSPRAASAHPLGNFTINHYAAISVGGERIDVRWVLDMAEIPAFSELQSIDADRDGTVSDGERDRYLDQTITGLLAELRLTVDGRRMPLEAVARELTFPPGQAGLDTLRLAVDFRATVPASTDAHEGSFADTSFDERVGWREIVVTALPDARLLRSTAPDRGQSDELRAYPTDGLEAPLDVRHASFSFEAGVDPAAGVNSAPTPGALVRPGGDPLAALVGGSATLSGSILALLLSLGLGAAHAVSPGHGKTLVAAYLVGSRSGVRQALILGLTVAITHTAGVFVLGAIILAASERLVPERVLVWLSAAAAALVVALGAWLVGRALGTRGALAAHGRAVHSHDHPAGHRHPHPENPRRGVVLIGLAGGLVPSASALIVLLASLGQGRFGYGVSLIGAFGLGMALVLSGVGIGVVLLRDRARVLAVRTRLAPRMERLGAALPLLCGLVVVGVGVVMAVQALSRLA